MKEWSMPQKNQNPTGDLPVRWEGKTRILVAFFLVMGCALAFVVISPVFTILAIGFIFSFILFYPVKAIAKRMPKHYVLALVIVFLLVALILLFAIISVSKNLISQAQDLVDQLENLSISQVQSALSSAGINAGQLSSKISSNTLIKDLGGQVTAGDSSTLLAGLVSSVATRLKGSITSAASGIANLFTGLVIGFLLMLNMHGGRGKLAAWIPPNMQVDLKSLLSAMDQMWVRYMLVQVIYASCIAAGSFIIFILLGVPAPLPLAIVSGLLSIVPIIGGLLASFVIAIPCLMLGSTKFTDVSNVQFALIVLILQLLVTQGVYFGIGLPLTGKMVKLPVVVVMLGAMIGISTGNLLVAFLAVPIISTVKVFGSYLLAKALNLDKAPIDEFEVEKEPGFFNQLMTPD
jgi:predicted PurR-regulated permease PerM